MRIGTIVSVDDDRLGAELAADAAEDDLALFVDDTDDFEEDGGWLIADGIRYEYSAVDDESGEITLADALAEDLEAGVWVAPATEEGEEAVLRIASVDFGEGKPVPVIVPHTLHPLLPQGVRRAEGAERVQVRRRGESLEVAAVPGRSARISATRIRSAEPDSPGAVCFQYDDCWHRQKILLDYHAELDQRVSLAVTYEDLTSSFGYNIGHPDCLDVADLKAAVAQGHELVNHTMHHISMLDASASTRRANLDDLGDDLEANGLPRPRFFAYPFGYRGLVTDRDLATEFTAFRYAGNGITAETPAERFRIGATQILRNSASLSSPSTSLRVDDVKALIRLLRTKPWVLSFFWHGGPSYTTEATIAEMKSLALLCKRQGIRVITVSEAIDGFNRVPNPSFEDGLNGWPIFLYTGDGEDEAATVTPYPGGEGTQAWHGTLVGSGDVVQRGTRFPVKPSERYLIGGRYKLATGSGPTTRAADDFSGSGSPWPAADTGGSYTKVGGLNADYSEGSGRGSISTADAVARDMVLLTPSRADGEILVRTRRDGVTSAGHGNNDARLLFRHLGGANNDHVRVDFTNGVLGGSFFRVVKRVGGVETNLLSYQAIPGLGFSAATWYWVRVRFRGTTTWMRAWEDGDEEPDGMWHQIVTDASTPVAAGGLGLGEKSGDTTAYVTDFDDWLVVDTDPQDDTGLRMKLYWLDANGTVIGSVADSDQKNLGTSGDWKRFGFNSAQVVPSTGMFAELRLDLRGIAGAEAWVDHMVFALERLQPDGSLG